MTLIDSSDSILMLYSYSGFPERSFFIFSKSPPERDSQEETIEEHTTTGNDSDTHTDPVPISEIVSDDKSGNAQNDLQDRKDDEKNGLQQEPMDPAQSMTPSPQGHASDSELERDIRVKMNMMSGLSIILTLMSILVAFRYDYLIVQYNHNAKRPGSIVSRSSPSWALSARNVLHVSKQLRQMTGMEEGSQGGGGEGGQRSVFFLYTFSFVKPYVY